MNSCTYIHIYIYTLYVCIMYNYIYDIYIYVISCYNIHIIIHHLNVVSDVVQDVVHNLNGIPSKQLNP